MSILLRTYAPCRQAEEEQVKVGEEEEEKEAEEEEAAPRTKASTRTASAQFLAGARLSGVSLKISVCEDL